MHTNQKKHLVSTGFFILSFLIAFAVFIERLELHRLLGFDGKIIEVVQRKIDHPITRFMKLFSFLGSPGMVSAFVGVGALLLYRNGHRREASGLIVANAAGVGFNEGLKYLFRRQRPDIHRLVPIHGYSFPSGHSIGSVMFYGTLCYFLWKKMSGMFARIIMFLTGGFMVLVTGLSRVYLGVHYPSDVLSGYAAAGAWLGTCIKGFNAYLQK
jgi:phosphatidylglycerophosphatase B